MTEIEFLHEMVKAAGGDPNMLKDKLKSTYYECLIDCMKSGEYTQPEWGYKEEPVLNETKVTYEYNAAFNATVAILDVSLLNGEFEDGEEYNVYYNRVKYTCVCKDGMLGNGAIIGAENTGEPFCVGIMSGVLLIAPIDQTEKEATVSVMHGVYKQIEENYLQYIPYVDLVKAGLPTVNEENAVSIECDKNLQKEILKAYEHGAIRFNIKGYFSNGIFKFTEDEQHVLTAHTMYTTFDEQGGIFEFRAGCFLFGRMIDFQLVDNKLEVSYKKIADYA